MTTSEPVFEAVDGRLIRPRDYLRNAVRYRVFLGYWLRRNILARYRQTTLGPLWAVLQPLLSGAVYAFVFALEARRPDRPRPASPLPPRRGLT